MRNKLTFLTALASLIIAITAQAAPKPKPTPTPPPPASIPITGLPYSISGPGTYVLLADLPFNTPGGTAITISSNNVILDLGGHTITNFSPLSSASPAFGVYAWTINALSNITVRNGTIAGFDVGIQVYGPERYGANNITISGITLNVFNADLGAPLSLYGIFFAYVSNSQVTNCVINDTEYAIFDMNDRTAVVFSNVKIQSSINPFCARNGAGNTLPTFNTLGNCTFQ